VCGFSALKQFNLELIKPRHFSVYKLTLNCITVQYDRLMETRETSGAQNFIQGTRTFFAAPQKLELTLLFHGKFF